MADAKKQQQKAPPGSVYAPVRQRMLVDQLPYFEFEDNEQSPFHRVHLLADGALGICWKTPVPPSYSYDEGHLQTVRELQTFLENLPADYEAQIIITSHNNLEDKMKRYLESSPPNERAKILRHSRAEKLLESGFNGYPVAPGRYSMLRDTYMIITLRTPEAYAEYGLFRFMFQAMESVANFMLSHVGVTLPAVMDIVGRSMKACASEFQEAVVSAESTLDGMFNIERIYKLH